MPCRLSTNSGDSRGPTSRRRAKSTASFLVLRPYLRIASAISSSSISMLVRLIHKRYTSYTPTRDVMVGRDAVRMTEEERPLAGCVALVAGATRGAGRGIAVELGAAGATVYVTGRTTRSRQSEMNRPETIEETAELVNDGGGRGIAVQVDHLVPDEVCALVTRIEDEQGFLHVLVNDIWGATKMEWNKT